MAFCANCGHKVKEYDKFCPRCGVATRKDYFSDSKNKTGRKESYDGEIKKCPHCGETLKSFEAICPTCGYELRNTVTSNYIQDFFKKLESADSPKQKDELIRHFVMPNTKEDIFEFMILAAANLEAGGDNTDAWLIKLEQAYQKAKYIFKDSSELEPINNIYNNATKNYRKIRFHQKSASFGSFFVKHWKGILLSILGVLAIIFFTISALDMKNNYMWGLIGLSITSGMIWIVALGLNNKGEE